MWRFILFPYGGASMAPYRRWDDRNPSLPFFVVLISPFLSEEVFSGATIVAYISVESFLLYFSDYISFWCGACLSQLCGD